MIEIIGTELNQWDVGRLVQITGIEARYAHFANKGDSKAVIMDVVDKEAKIPDYLLQTGKPLCVYAVKDGTTIESRTFYVKNRERPESYVYEDDQRNYIYKLITDAENAVDDANLATKNANLAAESANASVVNANTATDNANNAAGSANEAANNANEAAAKAAHTAKSLMVVGNAEGANIYLDDAIEQYLVGMRIFGKTTQAGTPSPDSPVDLVSVGDDGDVGVTVVGKNLVDITKATQTGTERITVKNDTIVIDAGAGIYGVKFNGIVLSVGRTYTMSVGNVSQHDVNYGFRIIYDDGASSTTYGDNSLLTITVTKPIKSVYFYVGYGLTATSQIVVTQLQIEEGATRTAYEPYKAQSLTISTPNGLPGIPVTSGGNYTDENGQQWICDEIDFTKGLYVQRVGAVVLDGSTDELWAFGTSYGLSQHYIAIKDAKVNSDVLNSAFQSKNRTIEDGYSFVGTTGRLSCFSSTINTAASWRDYLSTTPITVYYVLAEQITEALTDEAIVAYASMHTYRGNTTVSNDASAHMELEYVMDAKKYIDSMLQPPAVRIAQVKLLASAWAGSGNLYSQVVTIDGITENSQVNLTPSIQQLAIFYEKNITFSTVNEGGVVTVYVIGQKPVNDYTIQADIVEVIV